MAKMRKEIIEIEKELCDRKTESHHRKYCFSDIEGAIAKFSGDDSYMIEKWVDDFEMVMAPLASDDGFHLMCARRLMSGTARIWLRTVIAPTWAVLRDQLIGQFKCSMTVSDVLRRMASEKYNIELGLSNYIIRMKEIAMHGPDLGERELLHQILIGLQDNSGRAGLLYSARTVEDLFRVAHQYDRLRREATRAPVPVAVPRRNSSVPASVSSDVLCYNCSGKGHMSRQCPKPKRVMGACFRCGSRDHTIRDCPASPVHIGVTAVTDSPGSVNDSSEALDHNNYVRISFEINETNNTYSKFLFSLFDTGSPVSFIRRSLVPEKLSNSMLKEDGKKLLTAFVLKTRLTQSAIISSTALFELFPCSVSLNSPVVIIFSPLFTYLSFLYFPSLL